MEKKSKKNKIFCLLENNVLKDMSFSQHFLESKKGENAIILLAPDETGGVYPKIGDKIDYEKIECAV